LSGGDGNKEEKKDNNIKKETYKTSSQEKAL
jgi:hypothetical protein